jgi:hypothetical protein
MFLRNMEKRSELLNVVRGCLEKGINVPCFYLIEATNSLVVV